MTDSLEIAGVRAENIALRTRLLQLERLLGEALLFGSPTHDDAGVCLGYLAPDEWMRRVELFFVISDREED